MSAPPSEPLDISALSVTPSEEILLCSCSNGQLAAFPLANVDILAADDNHLRFLSGGGLHHAAITGISVCVKKPLFVTCSVDRTLRVWNYATRVCEQARNLHHEPQCM